LFSSEGAKEVEVEEEGPRGIAEDAGRNAPLRLAQSRPNMLGSAFCAADAADAAVPFVELDTAAAPSPSSKSKKGSA
jgi:hypothetical protein